jgi:hypothetical protein
LDSAISSSVRKALAGLTSIGKAWAGVHGDVDLWRVMRSLKLVLSMSYSAAGWKTTVRQDVLR